MSGLNLNDFYSSQLALFQQFETMINLAPGDPARANFDGQVQDFLDLYASFEIPAGRKIVVVSAVFGEEALLLNVLYQTGVDKEKALEEQIYYFGLTLLADPVDPSDQPVTRKGVVLTTRPDHLYPYKTSNPHQQVATSVATFHRPLDCLDTKCVEAVIICDNAKDFNDILFRLVGCYLVEQPTQNDEVFAYYNRSLPPNLLSLQQQSSKPGYLFVAPYFALKDLYAQEYDAKLTKCDVADLVGIEGLVKTSFRRETCKVGDCLDKFYVRIGQPRCDADISQYIEKYCCEPFDFEEGHNFITLIFNYWCIRKNHCGKKSIECHNGCRDDCCKPCKDECQEKRKPEIKIIHPKDHANVKCHFCLEVEIKHCGDLEKVYRLYLNDYDYGLFEAGKIELELKHAKNGPLHIKAVLVDQWDRDTCFQDKIKVHLDCRCHNHRGSSNNEYVDQTGQITQAPPKVVQASPFIQQNNSSKGCTSCQKKKGEKNQENTPREKNYQKYMEDFYRQHGIRYEYLAN